MPGSNTVTGFQRLNRSVSQILHSSSDLGLSVSGQLRASVQQKRDQSKKVTAFAWQIVQCVAQEVHVARCQ